MILLLESSGGRHLRILTAAGIRNVCAVASWDGLERRVPGATASVVMLESLADAAASRLRSFQRRFPSHAVVLVTRGCVDNARYLNGLMVREIVWLCEVERALPAAVLRAVASSSLHALAHRLTEALHLPRSLREGVVHACLAERPIYSVERLAAGVHCDRSTLSLQWRRVVGSATDARLIDLLALILVTHAVRRRNMGEKVAVIASELDIHEHTLRRLIKRWDGPAAAGAASPQPRADAALEEFVRTHLLTTRALGAA